MVAKTLQLSHQGTRAVCKGQSLQGRGDRPHRCDLGPTDAEQGRHTQSSGCSCAKSCFIPQQYYCNCKILDSGMSHPWKCSRLCWMRAWVTWSSKWHPAHDRTGWSLRSYIPSTNVWLVIPSKVIVGFCAFKQLQEFPMLPQHQILQYLLRSLWTPW